MVVRFQPWGYPFGPGRGQLETAVPGR